MTSDRHDLSPAFIRRIHPRRYDFTIEDVIAGGAVLTVSDVTAQLEAPKRRFLRRWTWSTHAVRLVAAKAGRCRRWRLLCPACERRCEALFKVPGQEAAGWRCRICAGLQYSSRRHGPQHPARHVPTPRQRIIAMRRDERHRRWLLSTSDPWWVTRRDALLDGMARAIWSNETERARAVAWLREQLQYPRAVAVVPERITRSLSPAVLEILQRLNGVSV